MAGIFAPKTPNFPSLQQAKVPDSPMVTAPPRVVRMPTETDPDILAAQQRTRQAAMRRTGRQSTILTDNTRDTVGSSGRALGA